MSDAFKVAGAVLAIVWGAVWYLPAWLAGSAWNALRTGWRDGAGGKQPEE